MVNRRHLMAATTLGTFAALTGACSTHRPAPTAPQAADKVTYLTGLGAFGREAFAWVADAKGYFRDAGIQVTIVPGAAGDENLKKIAAGIAQFGVIDYSGAVIRAGRAAFDPFRLVAALNNQTLIAIMALLGRGIMIPADLKGKTIAQAEGAVVKTLFPRVREAGRAGPEDGPVGRGRRHRTARAAGLRPGRLHRPVRGG
jgi:NitT/TauT family transport system substrate-binding protein